MLLSARFSVTVSGNANNHVAEADIGLTASADPYFQNVDRRRTIRSTSAKTSAFSRPIRSSPRRFPASPQIGRIIEWTSA
jgi:hypothetical protein